MYFRDKTEHVALQQVVEQIVTGLGYDLVEIERSAGGLLRDRLETGLLVKSYDQTKAEKLVDGRGVASSLALWGASHLARRSPIGLAVVAGGLAAKVFYDRGKRLEKKRRAKKAAPPES